MRDVNKADGTAGQEGTSGAALLQSAAMITVDVDGLIRCWNAGAEALLGYSAEQAVGQTLDLIVPTDLRARHWMGFRRAMRQPLVKDRVADLPVTCADGQVRHFAGRLLVLSTGLGEAVGATAIFTRGSTGVRPFSTAWIGSEPTGARDADQ